MKTDEHPSIERYIWETRSEAKTTRGKARAILRYLAKTRHGKPNTLILSRLHYYPDSFNAAQQSVLRCTKRKEWTDEERDERNPLMKRKVAARKAARTRAILAERANEEIALHIAECFESNVRKLTRSKYATIEYGDHPRFVTDWDVYPKRYAHPCRYTNAAVERDATTGIVTIHPSNGDPIKIPGPKGYNFILAPVTATRKGDAYAIIESKNHKANHRGQPLANIIHTMREMELSRRLVKSRLEIATRFAADGSVRGSALGLVLGATPPKPYHCIAQQGGSSDYWACGWRQYNVGAITEDLAADMKRFRSNSDEAIAERTPQPRHIDPCLTKQKAS